MKKILALSFIAVLATTACTNNKDKEKKQLDEILKIHDKVMGESERAIKNKSVLDSLIHTYGNDTSKLNTAAVLNRQLVTADGAMEKWMHEFNPDYTGKSHTEIMEYLHSQHLQLSHIDSLMGKAIRESDAYLLKTK